MKIATVSTVRGVDRSFLTFLAHHAGSGVDRLYVVLDEPERDAWLVEAVRADGRLDGRVRFVPRDAVLQRRIEGFELYRASPDLFSLSVVTRQRIHVALVNELAVAEGVEWLIHLDADELIVPHGQRGLREYLAALPAEVVEVLLPNFEAMPHKERFDDAFLEVSRFKKGPYYLDEAQLQRLRRELGRPQFYVGYASGKSAFRPAAMAHRGVPTTVHLFSPSLEAAGVRVAERGGPIVLHYPMVGFAAFVKRVSGFNYNRLNEYEVESEDLEANLFTLAKRKVARGEIGALLGMYRRWVLYDDPAEIERLRGWGVIDERPYAAPLSP